MKKFSVPFLKSKSKSKKAQLVEQGKGYTDYSVADAAVNAPAKETKRTSRIPDAIKKRPVSGFRELELHGVLDKAPGPTITIFGNDGLKKFLLEKGRIGDYFVRSIITRRTNNGESWIFSFYRCYKSAFQDADALARTINREKAIKWKFGTGYTVSPA